MELQDDSVCCAYRLICARVFATMFSMFKRLFFCLAVAALPAVAGADSTPSVAPQALPEVNDTPCLNAVKSATAALQRLHKCLSSLRTPDDAVAALLTLEGAILSYEEAMLSIPETWRLPDTEEAQQLLDGYLGALASLKECCTQDDFISLMWQSDVLKYYLLQKSPQLPCFIYEETAEYMMMMTGFSVTDSDEPCPKALEEKRAAIREEAAARHAAFMQEHATEYAGGNGADAESAIVLRPVAERTEGAQQVAGETEELLISRYMRAVYPQFQSGYGFVEATPDGGFYHILAQYPGLYEAEDGSLKLATFYVFFCTSLPESVKK